MLLVAAALIAVVTLVVTGTSSARPAATPTAATPQAATQAAFKVALVTDIGGLDDRSFNFLANQGLKRAQAQLGVQGRVFISKSNADYVPNLSTAARQGYNLVIAVGFLMADSIATVAKAFPRTKFAIIDNTGVGLKGGAKNVRGLLFKEQEAGYLVGYLAGLVVAESAGSNQTISSVGGQKIPPVDRYIAGYEAGAKAANAKVTTLHAYSQDFVDQARCKEVALNQIARGSAIVFQVAGQCGLGALNAAKEQNALGIGVDADQGYLGEHVITSALKKVDVAVFQTIQAVQDGSFGGGEDTVFDVASGGVGLGEIAASVPSAVVAKVKQVQERLAAGSIPNIPETVG
jgi:basic membrane protein A